jgi:hypothetical protein
MKQFLESSDFLQSIVVETEKNNDEARRLVAGRPSQSPVIENALEKFLAQQGEFLRFVREAKGLDYNKTRLRSPVTPLMRYSLADAFVGTVVDGWRHLAQARRMSETEGFPTN